ncbi:MAG: DUF3857 domain-containing protein [Flavobacteriales bacterium]|nr:DUF3857 domain-containing protein [Flavobacteriales bacterium]MBK6945390.1 DUF3857 domain-containing protein [Flavobacteriales bacterium]HQV52841.1 DUF3857 domain-containing protein [Flavobacteriales bacterium]
MRAALYLIALLFCGQAFGQNMSEQLVLLRRTYQDQSSVYLRNNTTYHIVRTEKGIVSTREIENDRMLLKDIVGDVQEERVYYSDLMPLKEIEAYTLIPKGNGSKRIKIGAVEHRDQRSNSIFHDDSRIAYFTMPSLASGAVAHLRYVVAFPDARFSTGHYFASEFPVEESILTVISDADIDVDVRTFHMPDGSYTRSVSTEKGKTVQRYTMRNVPPMKFASDAPSFSYYTPHAQLIVNTEKVESTDRVDQLYGWLYSYVGQCSDPADASITALTDSLTANILVPQEKASVIYRWVQDHIRYIAFEDGLNGLIPAPAEEVSRVRYGDCKGMSNVLQTMLRAAGLDAHLAWIGTRDRPYTFNELPAAGSSDHMIVALYLADTTLFLDGTANVNAFGFPSGFTQGKEALIAMDSATYNISTVPVMPAAASVLRDDVRLKFVGNELVGTGRITLTGYDRHNLTHYLRAVQPNKVNDVLRSVLMKGSNKFQLDSTHVEGLNDREAPLSITYTFRLPDHMHRNGDRVYLPLTLSDPWKDLRFAEERVLPLEFPYEYERHYTVTLDLPEGAQWDGASSELKMDINAASYSIMTNGDQRTITTNADFVVNRLIMDEELNDWRDMNKSLLKDLGRTVVIDLPSE